MKDLSNQIKRKEITNGIQWNKNETNQQLQLTGFLLTEWVVGWLITERCGTQRTWRPGPACTWPACLQASALETLEFICGKSQLLRNMNSADWEDIKLTWNTKIWSFNDYNEESVTFILTFFHHSHGMSYPIAGNVKTHSAMGYSVEHPLVVSDEKDATGGVWLFKSLKSQKFPL